MLSQQITTLIDKELKKYPADQRQSAVMAALRFVQDEKGWIAPEDMADVAVYIGMPQMAVYHLALGADRRLGEPGTEAAGAGVASIEEPCPARGALVGDQVRLVTEDEVVDKRDLRGHAASVGSGTGSS